MQLGFTIDVYEGDVFEFSADALLIKQAARSRGLDAIIRKRLRQSGALEEKTPLEVGAYALFENPQGFTYPYIVMVGTVSVLQLGYQDIRNLGRDMLANLHAAGLTVQHVATTLQGVKIGRGLDDEEALRSFLLGFADAVQAGHVPSTLTHLTLVEREVHRAQLIRDTLRKYFPTVDGQIREAATDLEAILDTRSTNDFTRPLATDETPHVFVAMPFAEKFDDQYYLAIRPSVTENGLLCVRLDQPDSTFTGDIMEQLKERIRNATLVIALLDTANPNVYLEVGYAWGVETPTLLLLHEEETPPFDVQGARIITYNRIYKLKQLLNTELKQLLHA